MADHTNEKQLKKRFADLLAMSERNYVYYFTDFLSPTDAELLMSTIPDNAGALSRFVAAFGGADGCERVMLRLGSEEEFGYTAQFPIRILKISPKNEKFADSLTHRDFLGALMHLGIERDVLGDIVVRENAAYVFVKDSMADYVRKELTMVRHTAVIVSILERAPEEVEPQLVPKELNVASARPDAIIAKLYNLPRERAKNLFAAGLVARNGRTLTNESAALKDGDVLSVRGYGKFVYHGIVHETKKGRIVVRVDGYA